MVGAGLHRVDQHRQGAAALPGPPAADPCRRSSASTTCGCRRPAQAQSELAQEHGVEAFATGTTGSATATGSSSGRSPRCSPRAGPSISFCLAWANQTWTGIWHGATDRILKEQTYPGAGGRAAPLRRGRCRRSATSATSGSTAGRCSTSSAPRSCRTPEPFVDRWQEMAARAGLEASTSWPRPATCSGAGPRYTTAAADGFDADVYMRLPARVDRATHLRMRVLRKALGGPEVYPYSDEAGTPAPGRAAHPAVRLPQLGQHAAVRVVVASCSPGPLRRSSAATSSGRRRPRRPSGAGATAVGQVVERVGRGQPPRARPAVRPGWLEALRDGLPVTERTRCGSR